MNQMNERLAVGGGALLIGLLLGWMIRGVAAYSTTTETVTAFQDWRTACPAATAPPARPRRGIRRGCRVHAAETT